MMKNIMICALFLLIGCKSTVYVPIDNEVIKKEYVDRYFKDSIYLHDSIFVEKWRSGDTIYLTKEKYKYVYRDKIVSDSIYIIDSVKVEIPYPIVETKEVNKLKTWQITLMCLGGVLIGFLGFRIFRLFK